MLDELENIREGEAADTASPKRPCRRPKLPNRIAKDSSRKDPQLDILSDGAERLYWRLILAADDFGRFEADPRIVKADCFPLKIDSLRTATVEKWLDEIEKAGLVKFYSVLNRGYGQFITFDPPRAAKSKFPAPNDAEVTTIENKGDSICKQMIADAPVFDVRIRSSSSYSDTKSDPLDGGSDLGSFEEFWEIYPRKTAKSEALKSWKKLGGVSEALLIEIVEAVERQKQSQQWNRDGGQYIPHPATWLNQKRWQDQADIFEPQQKPQSMRHYQPR